MKSVQAGVNYKGGWEGGWEGGREGGREGEREGECFKYGGMHCRQVERLV